MMHRLRAATSDGSQRSMMLPGGQMRFIEGIVLIVQDGRFQLLDDGGAGHLCVLSPGASAEPGQLAPLQRKQARVRIGYDDATNAIGLLVHSIALLK